MCAGTGRPTGRVSRTERLPGRTGRAGRRGPMRDTALRRWQRWRVAVVPRPAADPVADRFSRPRPAVEPAGRDEVPGPDGIRHGLVARVRREIEAGTYDTEERWLAAEERLLRRVCEGA